MSESCLLFVPKLHVIPVPAEKKGKKKVGNVRPRFDCELYQDCSTYVCALSPKASTSCRRETESSTAIFGSADLFVKPLPMVLNLCGRETLQEIWN